MVSTTRIPHSKAVVSQATYVLGCLEESLRGLASLEAVGVADSSAGVVTTSFDRVLLSYSQLLPLVESYSVPSDIQDLLDIWSDFLKENS